MGRQPPYILTSRLVCAVSCLFNSNDMHHQIHGWKWWMSSTQDPWANLDGVCGLAEAHVDLGREPGGDRNRPHLLPRRQHSRVSPDTTTHTSAAQQFPDRGTCNNECKTQPAAPDDTALCLRFRSVSFEMRQSTLIPCRPCAARGMWLCTPSLRWALSYPPIKSAG